MGKRTVTDLADEHSRRGRNHLRLAVAERGHDRGGDDLGADNRLAGLLVGRARLVAAAARHDDDLNGIALLGPPAVVQVVEAAGAALVEDGGAAQGERAVAAVGEAGREDGAGLGRAVELELVVGRDVAGALVVVGQDAVDELRDQDAIAGAGGAGLWR